ncbi:MAG TPA: TetR/AcrR family transcriptional regulator [Pseudonocardia sp.]|jgi:AcrR family transcriptional regulator|nr:TetR/AcrR family transcriptional regulator [Pseudonocardia sp.]
MPGGRPRSFDVDDALDRAVEAFWRHGYEGASLQVLTGAMGINKTSMYAAFGRKEELFHRAVARYAEIDMAYARQALDEPTAHGVVSALLRDNTEALTQPGRPPGCLSIQGGASCGPDNAGVCEFLAASRLAGERALADRLARAVDEGDLPATADPAALARFVMIFAEGQAVHAAAGVPREQLRQAAAIALTAFDNATARTDPEEVGGGAPPSVAPRTQPRWAGHLVRPDRIVAGGEAWSEPDGRVEG